MDVMLSGVKSSCRVPSPKKDQSGRAKEEDEGGWRNTHVELVVDLDHGGVRARAEALDLEEGELLVGRRLAESDAEVRRDRVDDRVGTAPAEHARGRRADLDKVVADGFAVEHGVEARDLVDAHRGHLEDLCDVVHDADRREVLVLLLGDLEERDHGRLLVLGRVLCDDLLRELLVLGVERERNRRVVVRRVAVLAALSAAVSERRGASERRSERDSRP